MYALIENNAVTQVGELSILFPNTSNPTHAFAIEQGALEVVEDTAQRLGKKLLIVSLIAFLIAVLGNVGAKVT